MKVVIAPDSFKGSASAGDLSLWIRQSWHGARPDDQVICAPMADGGEGSAAVIAASNQVDQNKIAVVELAEICGLSTYTVLDPLGAHTFDFGVAIKRAIESGAQKIILCVGGSASTDAGTGALCALGARFLDKNGHEIPLGGAGLLELAEIDLSGLVPAPAGGITIFSDVTHTLTGKSGAAHVFAPQKGATPEQIELLDTALLNLVRITGFPEVVGSGAAGGTTYGFQWAYEASIESGSRAIAELIGLPALISGADVVITGEGRYDEQSLHGKVISTVTELARDAGVAHIAYLVGDNQISAPEGVHLLSLTHAAGSREAAQQGVEQWVKHCATELARNMKG